MCLASARQMTENVTDVRTYVHCVRVFSSADGPNLVTGGAKDMYACMSDRRKARVRQLQL